MLQGGLHKINEREDIGIIDRAKYGSTILAQQQFLP